MSTINLNNGNAGQAIAAYYDMARIRGLAMDHGKSDGHEAVDSFGSQATQNVQYGDLIADDFAKVTFDPKKPVATTYDEHQQTRSFDPTRSGAVTVKNDVNNTHDFSTIFEPHTHETYKYSPTKGEHLVSREGLSTTTVDVSPSGTWTIQKGTLLVPNSPKLVFENFDNRDARFNLFEGTNFSAP